MKKNIGIILIFLFTMACEEEAPIQFDGGTEVQVVALWNDSNNPAVVNNIPLANAEIFFISEYGMKSYFADENGLLELYNVLPAAIYQITVTKKHPTIPNILIAGDMLDVEIKKGSPFNETIYGKPDTSSGISINEIYSAGPLNDHFYLDDQFIELYNSSAETRYLDGIQVYRVSGTDNSTQYPGVDWDRDDDIDGVTWAFKFPGKPGETEYPFAPNTFISIAQMAYDHTEEWSTSIDLSNADWEFFNQLDPLEFDNPVALNLESFGSPKNQDFMIRTYNEIIIIANGIDTVWEDGIDVETILDGVEYQLNYTYPVTLDNRVDKGWIKCPSWYSGKSMQRREPGLDRNNASIDWLILDKPTPGFQ